MYRTPGRVASNQAATALRTASALRNLAADLEMSKGNQRILLDAASILAASGRDRKAAAARLKAEEAEIKRKRDAGEAEARKILDGWPAASIADRIALCLSWEDRWNFEGEKLLRLALGGYTDWSGLHHPTGWRNLESVVHEFRRAVSREAGYRASRKGISVDVFMAGVRDEFQRARQGETCQQLTEAWNAALVAERLANANTSKGAYVIPA